MATAPQTSPYDRNRIREGRLLFFVPGGSANRPGLVLDQLIGHQRHHREQSKKGGRGPRNRQVAPLSLRFYPQMRPGFLKGHFHSPTANEPTQHLLRRMIEAGREQGLRLKLIQRIADQHPTDWNRTVSAAIPDRRLGVDFDLALLP